MIYKSNLSKYSLFLLVIFLVFLLLFQFYDSSPEYSNSFYYLQYNASENPIKILELVDSEKYDELINGESALKLFQKLSRNSDLMGRQVHPGLVPQVLSAFAYVDHFSVVISTPTNTGSRVFCRYIGENGEEVADPVETLIYPIFVVYCSRRNETRKLGVTFEKNTPLTDKNTVTLMKRKFKEHQHNVSFCLAPTYGNEPKWLHIVELIEHYKLQGVTHFKFYIRTINDYDRKIIKSYEESGEVDVIQLPPTNDDVIAQQLMGVADCLLRSRTFSKWSIFADIDERLIMTDEKMTIDKFLRNVTDDSIGSIGFPQRWIMKREQLPAKFENDDQVIDHLPTRKWHETSSPAIKGHRVCQRSQESCWAKDILNNEKVIRMLVHEVKEFYPGYKEWFLDPKIGYIRHYRDVKMGSWEANNRRQLLEFGPFSETSYPPYLGNQLLKNVLKRLHQVY